MKIKGPKLDLSKFKISGIKHDQAEIKQLYEVKC